MQENSDFLEMFYINYKVLQYIYGCVMDPSRVILQCMYL